MESSFLTAAPRPRPKRPAGNASINPRPHDSNQTSLPLGLVLLIADAYPASASLMSRSLHKIHGTAVKHTKSLARDLRVAFGVMLVAQDPSPNTHVVYCKPGKSSSVPSLPLGGGDNTNPNGTSSLPPSSTSRAASTTRSGKPAGTAPASSPWKLTETHPIDSALQQGNSFYDGWEFFTGADPTHDSTNFTGIVEYVDEATGRANGILDVNSDGNAIMRVETTPNVPNTRKSIRITTQTQFNGALIIMDSVHMPTGCGHFGRMVWVEPWPNWPTGGEIDIVEAVHDYTNNQATIHTGPGCRLPAPGSNSLRMSGSVIGGNDCNVDTTGNQGCGIRAATSDSFGAGFNRVGGGTYAMQWDASGISIFFFPRGSEPADITNDVPRPDTWGLPQARWPAAACDPFQFFNNHHAIFDTTLCGDWAGGVWNVAGIPGQEQSCAQRTGFSTCEAFVRANGASMSEAYWEVKYVKLYQFRGGHSFGKLKDYYGQRRDWSHDPFLKSRGRRRLLRPTSRTFYASPGRSGRASLPRLDSRTVQNDTRVPTRRSVFIDSLPNHAHSNPINSEMFYYAPASRIPASLSYAPAPLSTPRNKYLAALAEAKAAEAEYLAAEAIQQEEEALRRRLEEIRIRKEGGDLLSRYGRAPYTTATPFSNLDNYPAYGYDHLAALRRQVEEEECLNLLALKEAKAEQERLRQAEEANLLSLRRQEQVALRLHQEREQARIASLFKHQAAAKARQSDPKFVGHQCHCRRQVFKQPSCQKLSRNSCQRPAEPRNEQEALVLHPALRALLGPDVKVSAFNEPAPAKPEPAKPSLKAEVAVEGPAAARQPAPEKPSLADGIQQALNLVFRVSQQPPQSTPQPEGIEQFLSLLGLSPKIAEQQSASGASRKADQASHAEAQKLQQFYDLFGLPAAKQQSTPQASGSSSKFTAPRKEECMTWTAPIPSKAPEASPSVESSLKEQLEARLNNEFSSEVRDTIQAIFASIQDSESRSTTSSPANSALAETDKGKGKATEASAEVVPDTTTISTPEDIANSLNEVLSIETAFQALEADFTFPSQLDFLAAHLIPGNPVSSDYESSATLRLAYTSHNHPVRFYEQALSALLTKLDSVDSFGNDSLRGIRRDVVMRVERALEEQEKEVEVRWRARLSKEAKPVKIEVTDAVPSAEPTATNTTPSGPAASSDFSPSITTSELKVEVTAEPEATTAAPEIPNDPAPIISTSETPSEAAMNSPDTQTSVTSNISNTIDATTSPSDSLAASVTTIKGYDVEEPVDDASPGSPDSSDAFLLSTSPNANSTSKRPNKDNDDAGSDWSEVEA
ncbi:hypothetical protein D9615_006352 [Tricholomella constricta]|uniref:GH16 domain-containing protein n=1 Tax=Tricholomella constricta TaxID=117010 RepID=A0A8H5M0Z0_9AGAR|nr:hypothetical protein D9615_006352 [Tricholomella constricta]